MRNLRILFLVTFAVLLFASFRPKPHLIVGNWKLVEEEKELCLFSKNGRQYFIERLTFSSDEIQSSIYLADKKKKRESEMVFGFNIFPPFDEFKTPMILLKDICGKKFRIVFSIISLDKEFLKLQFNKQHSSDDIDISCGILSFERTAGPPENMP
jgi:hypothetical protein